MLLTLYGGSFACPSLSQSVRPSIGPFIGPSTGPSAGWMNRCLPVRLVDVKSFQNHKIFPGNSKKNLIALDLIFFQSITIYM